MQHKGMFDPIRFLAVSVSVFIGFLTRPNLPGTNPVNLVVEQYVTTVVPLQLFIQLLGNNSIPIPQRLIYLKRVYVLKIDK